MIEIKTLSGVPFEQIHSSFKKAFADYVEPFDLTIDQLKYMVDRRGCNFELSFGAFAGDNLIGFTLNGIGVWNNEKTAYDTGTGIIKEYRKQGIATCLFRESLPILKNNNITQYLLEVIKTNSSAVELYKKAGFSITREFDYFVSEKKNLLKNLENSSPQISENVSIEPRNINQVELNYLKSLWDFQPSWQNSMDSIIRKIDHFKLFVAVKENQIIGYGIVEPHTGDIPQFAVTHKERIKGVGSVLFRKLVSEIHSNEVKIINSDSLNNSFKKFTKKIGLPAGHGQFEMILKI